jgi:hypothetical protein
VGRLTLLSTFDVGGVRGRFAGIRGRSTAAVAVVEVCGDFDVAVGQLGGVERPVAGLKLCSAAADDAVEAARAGDGDGWPLECPAGLEIATTVKDDDVLAQHVTIERHGGERPDLRGVPNRNLGLSK